MRLAVLCTAWKLWRWRFLCFDIDWYSLRSSAVDRFHFEVVPGGSCMAQQQRHAGSTGRRMC